MTDLIVDQAAAHAAGARCDVDAVETANAAEDALQGAENDAGAAGVSAHCADDASVLVLGPRDAAIVFRDDGSFDAHLPRDENGSAIPSGLRAAAVMLALTDEDIRSRIEQNFYHLMGEAVTEDSSNG